MRRFLFGGAFWWETFVSLALFVSFSALARWWAPWTAEHLWSLMSMWTYFNYKNLAAAVFPLPILAWLIFWRALERTLREASFAAKFDELRLTPLPPSRIARSIIGKAYLRYAFISLAGMAIGFCYGAGRPPYQCLVFPGYDAELFALETRNFLDRWRNGVVMPSLALVAAFVWIGFVFYFEAKRSMERFFAWPRWSLRWTQAARLFLVVLMPPAWLVFMGQAIDPNGYFHDAAFHFNVGLLAFFATLAYAEWLAILRIDWRRD